MLGKNVKVEPRLVKPFYLERKGEYKADLCRASALYTYGGYYFDVDTGVIRYTANKL